MKPFPYRQLHLLSCLVSLAILVVGSVACTKSGDKQDIEEHLTSEQIFSRKCASCHGYEGAGDGPMGGSFQYVANLASDEVQALSDEKLEDVMRNGYKTMPPVRRLTDKQVELLIQEVRHFGEKPAP